MSEQPSEPVQPEEPAQPEEPSQPENKELATLTKEELVRVLNAWDQKISAREDAKMHGLLDTMIGQLAERKEEELKRSQGQGPGGAVPQASGGFGFVKDLVDVARQFGLVEGEDATGATMIEQRFAKLLMKGYENYLIAQEKDFAKKFGVAFHEVEGGLHA